jgi:hypothetical protein
VIVSPCCETFSVIGSFRNRRLAAEAADKELSGVSAAGRIYAIYRGRQSKPSRKSPWGDSLRVAPLGGERGRGDSCNVPEREKSNPSRAGIKNVFMYLEIQPDAQSVLDNPGGKVSWR